MESAKRKKLNGKVWIMIGLILWAVLIILIVALSCPGFLAFFFFVALPIGALVFFGASWLESKFSK